MLLLKGISSHIFHAKGLPRERTVNIDHLLVLEKRTDTLAVVDATDSLEDCQSEFLEGSS